jgi:CheY-like chemotaxis protein
MMIPPTHRFTTRELVLVRRPDECGSNWLNRVTPSLWEAGFRMHRFDTGREALNRIEQGGIAGAVLFSAEAGCDGLGLARIIRSIDRGLPCWLVLSTTTQRSLHAAFELRVTGVMTEPVEPAEFSFTLTRALGGGRAHHGAQCSAVLEFTQERSDIIDG